MQVELYHLFTSPHTLKYLIGIAAQHHRKTPAQQDFRRELKAKSTREQGRIGISKQAKRHSLLALINNVYACRGQSSSQEIVPIERLAQTQTARHGSHDGYQGIVDGHLTDRIAR